MKINDKYMKIIKEVTKIMEPHNVYVTGGFCRDSLLGKEPKDIDFSTPATPEEIEECIRNSLNQEGHNRRVNIVGKKFGCLKCKVFGEDVDIVSFRTEHYIEGSRKPEVEYIKTITEDLSRRDFTCNAIAFRWKHEYLTIIDPFEGIDDIETQTIRAVGTPKQRFKEDVLRILRAIRFACRLGFTIEPETFKKMTKMSVHILDISKERWVQELDQILQSKKVGLGLRLLRDCNLFKYMIPELDLMKGYEQNSEYHDFTLDEHTIQVVEAVRKDTDNLSLLWAALLHDCAKPIVRTDKEIRIKIDGLYNYKIKSNYVNHEILSAAIVDKYALYLKWSKERHQTVRELVLNHLKEGSPLRKYDNLCKKK